MGLKCKNDFIFIKSKGNSVYYIFLEFNFVGRLYKYIAHPCLDIGSKIQKTKKQKKKNKKKKKKLVRAEVV